MKQTLTLFFILILNFFAANAQRYEWASFGEVASGNNNGSDGGRSVTRDNQGNLIMVGSYAEDFISGSDTIHAISLGNGTDVFVAKYSSTGTPIWIKGFGGNWFDIGYSVTTDVDGNVYVGAFVQTTNTTFPDTVISNLTNYQVIKFDANGNYKWSKFITDYSNIALIGQGQYIYYVHDENAIAKMDENGNQVWDLVPSANVGGSYLNDLVVAPNGDIVASGMMGGNYTSIPYGTITVTVPSSGGDYGYYLRIDSTSTPLQAEIFGPLMNSPGDKVPVAADATGNVYILGRFTGSLTAGTTIFSIGSNWYGILIKYNSSGAVEWADTIPANQLTPEAICCTNDGSKIFTGGSYTPAMVYGNGLSLPVNFNGDGFIVGFNSSDGLPFLVDHWGMPGSTDAVKDLTIDNNNVVYGAGFDYGGNPTMHCKTFNAKPGAILFAFSEESDTINININQNIDTLFANPTASFYQWLINGDSITGATNSNLVMTSNGTYTVIATNQFGCSDIDSFTITNLGINNSELFNNDIALYPNPFSSHLMLELKSVSDISVYNLIGEKRIEIKNASGTVALGDELQSGIYILKIRNSGGEISEKKIVKVE